MTGGDSGDALAGLAKIFNNPLGYNVLPYKNCYTRDGRIQYTGFFIPAHEFSLEPEYIDKRGVTDSVRFKAFYEEKRKNLSGQDLIDYSAENCFTPEEALLKQGDNIFDAELISQQLTHLTFNKELPKPEPVALVWDKNSPEFTKVNAYPLSTSKLLVLEPPITTSDGAIYKNLYVAGIDSIDMGTAQSAADSDVSDFCIVIKKRANGMQPPQYVAMYKDRPRDIRIAYDTALKLLVWYNCQAVLEFTKISFQQYLIDKHKDNLLMSRPEFAVSNKTARKPGKRLIGVPATESVIKHGLELVAAYLNDYWDSIYFEEMLQQLLTYSYEEKRKFDIVAALQMVEIGDEELMNFKPVKSNAIASQWKDVGYYKDDDGHTKYGVIPYRLGQNDRFRTGNFGNNKRNGWW